MDAEKASILVVETEAEHAALVRRVFDEQAPALQVHVAGSLAEARAFLAHVVPDLVLTDWHLPDGEGAALLGERAAIPMVVLASQGNEAMAVEALKAGALDYLVKTEQTLRELPLVAKRALRQWRLVQEHEAAQQALRRSEERYRGLFEYASEALFIVDRASARILKANQRAADLVGYAEADALRGLWIYEVEPPETRETFRARFTRIAEQGDARFEHCLQLPGGRRVDVEISTHRVDYDGESVLQCFVRDVSARKQAERALHERDEELRLALEAAGMGTWRWDVESGAVEWSEQVAAIFGLDTGAFDGTYDAYRRLIYPADVPVVEAAIQEVLSGGHSYHVRHRLVHPDGALRWIEARGRMEHDAAGRPVRLRGTVVDVTEREEAEAARRQAEQRYRDLFEEAPLMYVVTENRDGTPYVADCNQRLAETLGYPREELVGRPLADFYSEASRRALTEQDGYVVALDAGLTAERQLRRHDGRLIETIMKAVPKRDAEGRVWGTRAMYADITERKQAEEALRQSENRFRLLHRITTQADQPFDEQIQQVLRLTTELFGLDVGLLSRIEGDTYTVVASSSGVVQPGQSFPLGQTYCSLTYAAGELVAIEHMAESPHRQHPCYEVFGLEAYIGLPLVVRGQRFGTLNFSSKTPCVNCFDEDTREFVRLLGQWVAGALARQQGEEAVRQSEARLKEAQRLAVMGTWDWDLKTDSQHWSEELYHLYGLEPGAVEDTYETFQRLVHPDDRAKVEQATVGIFENFQDFAHELRIIRPDGAVRTLLSSVKIFLDESGTPLRLLGAVQDVTERRRTEAEARQVQQALIDQQRREKERVEAELARARDRLVRQTRLATVGQMAASIAHELRNPLGAVRNAVYYLRRRLPEPEGKLGAYLSIIEQEIADADRIITDLLDMSRAKAPAKQPILLAEAVREAFGRAVAPEAATLQCDFAERTFLVHADAGQLRQVLMNLFTNAVQAMPGPGRVTVEARHGGAFDEICVRDEGPGVPADMRERIFEPLFTTKAKGTGLGLAICRQIAERHGGTLVMMSEEGAGAAFALRLPSQAAAGPAVAAALETPEEVSEQWQG